MCGSSAADLNPISPQEILKRIPGSFFTDEEEKRGNIGVVEEINTLEVFP